MVAEYPVKGFQDKRGKGFKKEKGEVGGGGGALVRGILLFGIVHWPVNSINADTAALLLILLLVQIVVSTRPLSILHRPMNGINADNWSLICLLVWNPYYTVDFLVSWVSFHPLHDCDFQMIVTLKWARL